MKHYIIRFDESALCMSVRKQANEIIKSNLEFSNCFCDLSLARLNVVLISKELYKHMKKAKLLPTHKKIYASM